MEKAKKSSGKEKFGWAMFDFANSSYTTVIITVVFSVLFPKFIVGDGPEYRTGNFLWSLALSISYLIVLASAPVIGAIMDFSASKKKFLFASYLLTVIFTSALYFVQPGYVFLGMLFLILSNIGFSLGEAFISSFLPHLGTPEELGKISGYAWALGYFGGLISTALVLFGLGPQTLENFNNLRFTGPITGAFFLLAAIPTFLWVKERGTAKKLPAGEGYFSIGLNRLMKTFRDVRDYRDLMILLVSFLFAYAGLSIVISFAFIYGDQVVRWTPAVQTMMFIITQLTAALGAFAFGVIQDRIGARRTYAITLALWVVAILLIYGTGRVTDLVNDMMGTALHPQSVFLVVGSIAGLGLGATQSSCRAMVGIFSPESKAGEFFGLWSLTGRLASIIGLIALGVLQSYLGLNTAILLCGAFFLIAIVVTLLINERRGMAAARAHDGE
ncbi:MAG: MFS transporter [Spirochaetes bacterium]|nr:MFS transporter [Spirochaetota bacterium]